VLLLVKSRYPENWDIKLALGRGRPAIKIKWRAQASTTICTIRQTKMCFLLRRMRTKETSKIIYCLLVGAKDRAKSRKFICRSYRSIHVEIKHRAYFFNIFYIFSYC